MTDVFFFDTDCLSAFLWVRNESLLSKLYPGRIVVPRPVYVEFCRPGVPHLKARIDSMVKKGEAASIALAKEKDGILESNNLKDVSTYINEFRLKHITTGDILVEAYCKGFITEDEGNTIWVAMLAKRRKLGAQSFSEFLSQSSYTNAP